MPSIFVLAGNALHQGLHVDVGCSASVDTLFKSAKNHTVPVSMMVNCAGIAGKFVDVVDTTEEVFDECIRVNLKGTFLMTRAAAREMIASGVPDAAIVNVASIVGKAGTESFAYYAASKGGVMSLTKSVAQELATKGIRCNAVLPGVTRTPMTAPFPEEVSRLAIGATPMKRLAEPEEIAEVIKFLCLPGSSYMTGSMVEVTGGLCM